MRHLLAVNTRTHSGEQHTEMGRFTEALCFPAGAGFFLLDTGPFWRAEAILCGRATPTGSGASLRAVASTTRWQSVLEDLAVAGAHWKQHPTADWRVAAYQLLRHCGGES